MTLEFDSPRPEIDYDNELSLGQQQRLVEGLLSERPPRTKASFAYYELSPEDPAANVARTVEAEVFKEFFKEEPRELKELYGPYEQQSRFFLAVDMKTGRPSGSLRVIEHGEGGLLTLNDLAKPPTDQKEVGNISIERIKETHGIQSLDDCWDIGAVAVRGPYRGGGQGGVKVAVMLYRAMYKKAMEQGITHIVSVIDAHPYARSMKPLGIPFKPLAGVREPFRYYGSKQSYAAYGYLPEFFPIMDRYRKSGSGVLVNLFAKGALTRLITGSRDREISLLTA